MRKNVINRIKYPEYGYFVVEIPIRLIDYHNVLGKLSKDESDYLRKLYNNKRFEELDEKLLKFCTTNPGSSNYYILFRYEKIRKRETLNQIAKRMSVSLLTKSTTKLEQSNYTRIFNYKDQFFNKDSEILELVKYHPKINRSEKRIYYTYDCYIAYCSIVLSRELLWKKDKLLRK